MKTASRGFTIVELLTVMAMIGTVVGMLLPTLQNAREAARRDACGNKMRRLTLALQGYQETFETFPPALVISPLTNPQYDREPAPVEGVFWSWAYRVAPYFGFQEFFDQIDPVEDFPFWSYFGPDHPNAGLSLTSQRNSLFGCPSDPRYPIENWIDPGNKNNQAAITSYLGVNGRNQFAEGDGDVTHSNPPNGQDGILYVNSSVSIDDITDGTSNTIILGERPPTANLEWGWGWAGAGSSPSGVFFGTADVVLGVHEWASLPSNPTVISDYFRPGEIDDPSNTHRYHFWSLHPEGGNWAFADGSIRFLTFLVDSPINETTDPDNSPPTVLAQFATRAGGIGLSNSDH